MMQNSNIPLMILSLWMRCLVGADEREPNGLAMDELLGWIQIALLPCSRSCDHCYHYHGVIIITSHQHTVISRVIPAVCNTTGWICAMYDSYIVLCFNLVIFFTAL